MTKEIIAAIGKRQVLRNHTPVVANVTTIFDWECDVLSVGKGGSTYEFEVKISRSDFLRDKKKRKWNCQRRMLPQNTPNYMIYVCPDGLIQLNEIPDFSGLYYFKDGELIEVRSPVQRHKIKKDINEIQMKVARMYSQREFLGRTLISHLNKEIRERNAKRESEMKNQNNTLMEYLLNKKSNQQGEETKK